MKKILLGVVLTIVVLMLFKFCGENKQDEILIKENSALIQEQIKNVGKLIVTEGHFSQVFTYKNTKAIFGNLVNVEKKALVVINADVSVAYDLSQIEYNIDESTRTLQILSIPKEEITINPDFEYYDVTADFLDPFDADDYNKIKETVKAQLMKKVDASDLKSNAKNRLLSELSKFYILTSSLGWTLQYNEVPITDGNDWSDIEL